MTDTEARNHVGLVLIWFLLIWYIDTTWHWAFILAGGLYLLSSFGDWLRRKNHA